MLWPSVIIVEGIPISIDKYSTETRCRNSVTSTSIEIAKAHEASGLHRRVIGVVNLRNIEHIRLYATPIRVTKGYR